MEHDFWHRRWRKNEIGFHQESINPYLREHWSRLDVPSNAPVFVPLCGKSRDMRWLRDAGHPVTGVELSRLAVEAFFAEEGLEPEVRQSGAFEIWQAGNYLGDLRSCFADCLATLDAGALCGSPARVAAGRPAITAGHRRVPTAGDGWPAVRGTPV
jgi:thiopurine S-methyltransferase